MNLNPRLKRILAISLFVLAAIALGYLLYSVFFQRGPVGTGNQNVNNTNNGTLPNINDVVNNTNGVTNVNSGPPVLPGVDIVASGGKTATTVLTDDAKDPALARDGSTRYYDRSDGKFYRVDQNGKITQLGTGQFPNVQTVTWSDVTNEAILEFPDGANIYFNLDSSKQVTLPKEFEEFDFSPTSGQIAFKYMHVDPERRVLAVSTPDGSGARTLESLGTNANHVNVNWSPTGKIAASYAEFIDLNRQELGFIGLNGENFKGTVVEGRGLRSQYSPDGQRLLYSVYSEATDYKPELWVVDADGENIGRNRAELNINTFADKCTFGGSSTLLYCAVPAESKFGFGLEPDILEDVPDDIYRIDLATGAKTKIAVPVDAQGNATYSVSDLFLVNDSSLVFFDESSGQLVKIDLK